MNTCHWRDSRESLLMLPSSWQGAQAAVLGQLSGFSSRQPRDGEFLLSSGRLPTHNEHIIGLEALVAISCQGMILLQPL